VSLGILEVGIVSVERLKIAVKSSCKPASSLWNDQWGFFGRFLCSDWAITLPSSACWIMWIINNSKLQGCGSNQKCKMKTFEKSKNLNIGLNDLPAVTNQLWQFGAEHRNPNSFYFTLAAVCILVHLRYSEREGLVTSRTEGIDGLVCLQPYLNYPWTWKVCTVLYNKVCRQPSSLPCLDCFGIKKKNEWVEWKRMQSHSDQKEQHCKLTDISFLVTLNIPVAITTHWDCGIFYFTCF